MDVMDGSDGCFSSRKDSKDFFCVEDCQTAKYVIGCHALKTKQGKKQEDTVMKHVAFFFKQTSKNIQTQKANQ